jgi:hypothetical protein
MNKPTALTLALALGLALTGIPAVANATDSVCMSGDGTAALCPVTVLHCAPGTAPGWLDVNGNPISCVDDHPCIATATQDADCNPIAPPPAVKPAAKPAAVAPRKPAITPAPVPAPTVAPVPAPVPSQASPWIVCNYIICLPKESHA